MTYVPEALRRYVYERADYRLASIDPQHGEIVRLYHPRTDTWRDHFKVIDGEIIPLTAIGRVTARLLRFNEPDRVDERARLMKLGRYPDAK